MLLLLLSQSEFSVTFLFVSLSIRSHESTEFKLPLILPSGTSWVITFPAKAAPCVLLVFYPCCVCFEWRCIEDCACAFIVDSIRQSMLPICTLIIPDVCAGPFFEVYLFCSTSVEYPWLLWHPLPSFSVPILRLVVWQGMRLIPGWWCVSICIGWASCCWGCCCRAGVWQWW